MTNPPRESAVDEAPPACCRGGVDDRPTRRAWSLWRAAGCAAERQQPARVADAHGSELRRLERRGVLPAPLHAHRSSQTAGPRSPPPPPCTLRFFAAQWFAEGNAACAAADVFVRVRVRVRGRPTPWPQAGCGRGAEGRRQEGGGVLLDNVIVRMAASPLRLALLH